MIGDIIVLGAIWTAIYALIAIGFSLIFGVAGIMNLSHGAFYMIASYLAYTFTANLGFGLLTAPLISVILTVVIAVIAYIILIKPMRGNLIQVLIISLALAMLLEQLVMIIFGPEPKHVPALLHGGLTIIGVRVTHQQLLAFIAALALIVILWNLLNTSNFGRIIRAVSQDREMAAILGVNSERVFIYVMGLSAALAAVAGILVSPFLTVMPHMGWTPLFAGFTIVVLGGLGNIWGTLLGAVIVAYAGIITSYTFDPQLRDAVTFAIMILALIFKPEGLFSKGVKE